MSCSNDDGFILGAIHVEDDEISLHGAAANIRPLSITPTSGAYECELANPTLAEYVSLLDIAG